MSFPPSEMEFRAPTVSAASALAALPWMQRADAVRILSADGYQRRGPGAPELAAYLAKQSDEYGRVIRKTNIKAE